MAKAYSELSVEERCLLDSGTFTDSVRLEAIKRGIAPPVSPSEKLKQGEYVSYTPTASHARFYELVGPGRYGSPDPLGIAFRTEDEAWNALKGAFRIYNEAYSQSSSVVAGDWSVRSVLIGDGSKARGAVYVTEQPEDRSAFDKVLDECEDDLRTTKQSEYDKRLNFERAAEYMRLAGGNEEVAKAFWSKTYGTAWPGLTTLPV